LSIIKRNLELRSGVSAERRCFEVCGGRRPAAMGRMASVLRCCRLKFPKLFQKLVQRGSALAYILLIFFVEDEVTSLYLFVLVYSVGLRLLTPCPAFHYTAVEFLPFRFGPIASAC
jgi:hypothetical protein